LNDELLTVVSRALQPAHVTLWLKPSIQPEGRSPQRSVTR
jgi:hypothetical protein